MMPKFDLIEVVPILGSDINKYREEIHDRIILNAIQSLKINTFTVDELNDKINYIFGIRYPRERLVHNLEILFKDVIDYSEGRIQINGVIPPVPNEINDLIEMCFKEFANSIMKEYDPLYIQRYRDAFHELIYETMKNILNSVNIIELDMDTIDFRSNSERMNEIITHHNIRNPQRFLDIFYNYLTSENENKDKIIISVFQYAITIDILNRGSELYSAFKEYQDKGILIIDTNIITALLLKSNRFHETVESMITLSNKHGFKIFYTSDTKSEFERLVDGYR